MRTVQLCVYQSFDLVGQVPVHTTSALRVQPLSSFKDRALSPLWLEINAPISTPEARTQITLQTL